MQEATEENGKGGAVESPRPDHESAYEYKKLWDTLDITEPEPNAILKSIKISAKCGDIHLDLFRDRRVLLYFDIHGTSIMLHLSIDNAIAVQEGLRVILATAGAQ